MPSVCVIGLGYVGLPLANLCSEKGYNVFGTETNQAKAQEISATHPKIKINDPQSYQSDIIIIAVPTPIDQQKKPDLSFVETACKTVLRNLTSRGQLIILESTVNPFVSRKVVLPILESTGLVCGKDFYLAHCPERIDPGNVVWNVANIPRVVGAISNFGLEKATSFYKSIISGQIIPLSSIESAEMVKIYENSLRAVKIAFANEMAIVMQNLGLDTKEVIEGVKTKPFGLGICRPGPGVGGHCIPVDPFYLISESQKQGFDPSFLRMAMQVNNFMPSYTVSLLTDALNEIGKSIRGTKIGILGVSYKKDVADLRQSPALEIINKLEKLGANVEIYDPHVEKYANTKREDIMNCTAILLLTNHSQFSNLNFSETPVVIDAHNILDKAQMKGIYKGIGR